MQWRAKWVSAGSPCTTSLFVPIKASTSVSAPPLLSSGPSVELWEQRGRYVGSVPVERNNTPEAARVGFSALRRAGYHSNQPPLPGGGNLLMSTFPGNKKRSSFSVYRFMRVFFFFFFKSYKRPFERNSWTIRSLKLIIYTFIFINL